MENILIQKSDEKILRVTYFDRLSSIIYVVDMEGRRWPYPMERDVLDSLLGTGEISMLKEEPYYRYVVEEELSDAEKKRRDYAWEIVSYVWTQVEQEQQLYITKYRQKAIQNAMAVYKVSYNTVKNYLVEYWQGGKVRNSLLPNYNRCGAKGKELKAGNVKRGRPRKNEGKVGVNVDDHIKKVFQIGLNRFYYNEKQNTLKTAYELTIKNFFTEEKIDQNGIRVPVLKDPSNIPTYRQFLYWFKRMNNIKHEVSKRKGSRVYYQKYRAIIGDSTQEAAYGPGTVWQIDSTPLDIYCVSSSNRNIIVGKPLLHLAVDVFSRVIVGFSLSFESLNAYSGAMVALLNSMTPKKEFCKKYGIEIEEDDWDVACIPQKIITDRGELNGKQIEGAIEGLGIDIQNSSSYRPEMKGIIEQALHRIQLKMKPHVQGALVHGNRIRERGERDFRLQANLTIDEVTAILIQCILFHNNHHVLNDYELSEDMLAEGIEKIPKQIWNFGIKHQKGRLRTLPEEVIKMNLLPQDTATITAKGLRYKKLYYASEYSLKNNWFESARLNGSSKITIRYDPRNLSEVYIPYENGNGVHVLTLLEHLTKYSEKGIDEIDQIIDYESKIDTQSKNRELQEKMKLFDAIERIVAKGEQKTEAERDNTESNTSKLQGIRENQKRERELERALLYKSKDKEELIECDESIAEIEEDDELALFRQLRE